MAHFAELNNQNEVLRVIVVGNADCTDDTGQEQEQIGVDFCKSLFGQNTHWKQTSYNNNFRVRYAGIGYTYNEQLDAFVSPKPFESWFLNEETAEWEAPIPYPTDGNPYQWNEEDQSWILIQKPE